MKITFLYAFYVIFSFNFLFIYLLFSFRKNEKNQKSFYSGFFQLWYKKKENKIKRTFFQFFYFGKIYCTCCVYGKLKEDSVEMCVGRMKTRFRFVYVRIFAIVYIIKKEKLIGKVIFPSSNFVCSFSWRRHFYKGNLHIKSFEWFIQLPMKNVWFFTTAFTFFSLGFTVAIICYYIED
jgi:hypothetical protein